MSFSFYLSIAIIKLYYYFRLSSLLLDFLTSQKKKKKKKKIFKIFFACRIFVVLLFGFVTWPKNTRGIALN